MTPCINALIAGRGDAKAPELLMLLFIVLMHDENHECDASFAELAKAYGCNERNAKLLVAKLKKRALLIVSKTKSEGHSRNVYRPVTCLQESEIVYPPCAKCGERHVTYRHGICPINQPEICTCDPRGIPCEVHPEDPDL